MESDKRKTNEIICEFMGRRVVDGWVEIGGKFKSSFHSENLVYHLEWNELMPVVEKINSSPLAPCIELGRNLVLFDTGESADSFYHCDHGGAIGATYQAVLRYIKWYDNWKYYNENNRP